VKNIWLYLLFLTATHASGQSRIEWHKGEKKASFSLNKLLLSFQLVDKPEVTGIFGSIASRPVFPRNYELHILPSTSIICLAIQMEGSSVTTAMLNYQFGKYEFSFSVDNLACINPQPPSFEISPQDLLSKIPQLNYKSGSPKFLQLSTIVNF